MLDELDARVLFLPQLEVAIGRSHNDEVRVIFMSGKEEEGGRKPILALANESRTGARRAPGNAHPRPAICDAEGPGLE